MPITKLTEVVSPADITIDWKCAACGNTASISANTLVLGASRGTSPTFLKNIDAIELPVCGNCGAFEQVLRTWDTTPAAIQGKPFHNHRCAANKLGAYLKSAAKSQADCLADHNAEVGAPTEVADISTPFTTGY